MITALLLISYYLFFLDKSLALRSPNPKLMLSPEIKSPEDGSRSSKFFPILYDTVILSLIL